MQLTSMSDQTHIIYVVRALKEFNNDVFLTEMEVTTLLPCMITVRNMLSSLRVYLYRGVQRTGRELHHAVHQ